MVNINKLRGKMVENEYTVTQLAAATHLNPSTIYRRFYNQGESFTLGEVRAISAALSLNHEDVNAIFFAEKSH